MKRNVPLATALAFMLVAIKPIRAAESVNISPDVVYGHKHGMALTFDVFTPEVANGAGVLFVVSGGWYSGWSPPENNTERFSELLKSGFTVFAVRHGSSPKFKIPEIVEDVRRSVRFIRLNAQRFGVDQDRLGVMGGSAGGHLSLVLGTTSDGGDPDAKDEVLRSSDRVAAVAAYFPPTDIRPWVTPDSTYYQNYPALQFDPELADDFSPLLHSSEDDPPTLMIHGDQDKLVPLKHSQNMLAAFEEKGVKSKLLVIEGAAHGFRGADNTRAVTALVEWFTEHLKE